MNSALAYMRSVNLPEGGLLTLKTNYMKKHNPALRAKLCLIGFKAIN